MEQQVKVSVVMCCYNEQRYIRESIDSVLRQTYKDFEFIIWNDGSTDKTTEEIVKSYKDSRIRYFYHENTGLGGALRLACQEAKGKYIARMDCDDICLLDRFENQVAFLDNHPDYVLCSTAYYYIDAEDHILGRRFPSTLNYVIKRNHSAIAHPTTMFRRDAYLKAGGYMPLKAAQDKNLWYRMMCYGKFVNLKEPYLKYRILPSSISHTIDYSSPYGRMIRILRQKMYTDKEVLMDDVYLHNELFEYAKKHSTDMKLPLSVNITITIEERFFNLLSKCVGSNNANKFVYIIKNTYCLLAVFFHK